MFNVDTKIWLLWKILFLQISVFRCLWRKICFIQEAFAFLLSSDVTEILQNHRITERLGLEGTSVGHLVQPSCQSRVTYSRLQRILSRRVLNISREGDSTTSLGSLFQCSVTLRVKKFFLMFSWNFLCFSLCPSLLQSRTDR